MIKGRIAFIRDGTQIDQGILDDNGTDGACVIGLGRSAYVMSLHAKSILTLNRSLSILIYDLMLNVFFTWLVNSLPLPFLADEVAQHVPISYL